MNIRYIMGRVVRAVKNNSGNILTGVAVAETVIAVVKTRKAALQEDEMLEDLRYEKEGAGEELTTKDIVVAEGKLYSEALAALGLAVGCTLGSNHVNQKKIAGLAANCAMLSKQLEKKNPELPQKAIEGHNEPEDESVPWNENDICEFEEACTGRVFTAKFKDIVDGANKFMVDLDLRGYTSLNSLYTDYYHIDAKNSAEYLCWDSNHLMDYTGCGSIQVYILPARKKHMGMDCYTIYYSSNPTPDIYNC